MKSLLKRLKNIGMASEKLLISKHLQSVIPHLKHCSKLLLKEHYCPPFQQGEFLLVKSWFVPRLQKLFKKNKILLRFLFFLWISINSLNELMKELWLGKFWFILGSSWSLVGRLSWYFSCPFCKYNYMSNQFQGESYLP